MVFFGILETGHFTGSTRQTPPPFLPDFPLGSHGVGKRKAVWSHCDSEENKVTQ